MQFYIVDVKQKIEKLDINKGVVPLHPSRLSFGTAVTCFLPLTSVSFEAPRWLLPFIAED